MNVWKIILFPPLTKICANIVDRMFWIKAFYEHSNNVGHESFPIYFYIDMMFSCKINQLKLKTCKTRKNCFRYLKRMSPLNAAICTTISYTLWVEWCYLKNNYLTLRSKVKVHEGHYSTRHTTLWSCTHIPNIIDLSGKTKKLWSGQASLRRSRRSGRGDIITIKVLWKELKQCIYKTRDSPQTESLIWLIMSYLVPSL